MENLYIFLVIIVFLVFILFNIFLVTFDNKIKKLEDQILKLFEKRTNLVPSLYEISKNYINKHEEVFNEVVNLKKLEFNNYNSWFIERIANETLIHHELNFIFKIINKHPEIQKNEKFLLIRDLFLENSSKIWKKIELYKNIIKKFNNLLIFKNLTIIWIFIKIEKRTEI